MSERPEPKTPPPLLGFNNNVKHRGRVFHIQTEDSGVKRPHVITHLFADGGRIVKSKKTTYTEHVGREDTPQVVRRLMKEQHKAMFIALRGGEFDELIEGICGPHPLAAPPPRPVEVPESVALPSSTDVPSVEEPAEAVDDQPNTEARSRRLSNPNLQRIDPEQARALARKVVQKELDIDVDSHLTRAPTEVKNTPVHGTPAVNAVVPRPGAAAVPIPAAASAAGSAVAGAVEAAAVEAADSAAAAKPVAAPPAVDGDAGRYAASRPAAIFEARPDEGSIFGGGISEQSLDDVILSYIAEDLDDA